MRSLKQFIVESVHTYNYTIKIAGQVDNKFLDMFKYNLKKFDPVKISDAVSTPIQKDPYGFPGIKNEPVHIIKAEFRYPANEPMIQQIAQLLGYNVNMVRVIGTNFDDSINSEMEGYANEAEDSPLLDTEKLGEQPGAKEAAKAYGSSYLESIKDQSTGDKIDIPFAGKKTPSSFDPFKPESYVDKKGQTSPMSKIKLPAKPETGSRRG
jgi:hypothetical protein